MTDVDASCTIVVEYKYDAWGKIIARTGSLVSTLGYLNPFRYRGYVYDEETGLYYLKNRYYNPEWGRFINADEILGQTGEILSHNLFAYCKNNPISLLDSSGNWPQWVETTFKVVSVVVVVVAAVVVATKVAAIAAGTLVGVAAAKALTAATVGLGVALSGINGGVANCSSGNSYANGYIGGAIGGWIQGNASKWMKVCPTIFGGGLGASLGTAVTTLLNHIDPDSSSVQSVEGFLESVADAGLKATLTSCVTGFMSKAVGGMDAGGNLVGAVADGAGGLMNDFTLGFGEAIKAFFGAIDDALVYGDWGWKVDW